MTSNPAMLTHSQLDLDSSRIQKWVHMFLFTLGTDCPFRAFGKNFLVLHHMEKKTNESYSKKLSPSFHSSLFQKVLAISTCSIQHVGDSFENEINELYFMYTQINPWRTSSDSLDCLILQLWQSQNVFQKALTISTCSYQHVWLSFKNKIHEIYFHPREKNPWRRNILMSVWSHSYDEEKHSALRDNTNGRSVTVSWCPALLPVTASWHKKMGSPWRTIQNHSSIPIT